MGKKILAGIAVLLLVGVGYWWYGYQSNEKQLETLGTALAYTAEGETTLNAVVPFAWDAVYTFPPYTGKEDIEAAIGFRSNRICETVSEGMVQLVFVKGKRIAAMVCGYPDALGYDVDFTGKITFAEQAVFTVSRKGDVVCLNRTEETKKTPKGVF